MGLLFRDINVLSAPNNSNNYYRVTTVSRSERGDDHRRPQKHKRHDSDHGCKSKKKHHCR